MGSATQIELKMKLAVSGATALLLLIVRNFTNENEIQQYEPQRTHAPEPFGFGHAADVAPEG